MTSIQAPAAAGEASGGTYVDTRRYLWAVGLAVPGLPLASWGLAALTGSDLWWWLTPVVIYLLIPLLDAVTGTDTANPPESAVPALEEDRYYRWLTWITVPLHFLTLIVCAWWAATTPMPWWAFAMLAYVAGAASGRKMATTTT